MSIIRIRDPDELRPVHVVMLVVLVFGLCANCWLTSAAKPSFVPAGAREWRSDSLLLAVVELLNLNYSQPTPLGVAIKTLATMTAAAVGMVVVGIIVVQRARGADRLEATDTVIDLSDAAVVPGGARRAGQHIDPIGAAQILLGLGVVWSLLSVLWSASPDFALHAAILRAGATAWAFVLAVTLNRTAVRYAVQVLVAVLAVTGLLAILYHSERNPTLRASYPVGNPILLATYLVVGLLLSVGLAMAGIRQLAAGHIRSGGVGVVGALVGIAVMAAATQLTRSRGPVVGLGVGVLLIPVLLLKRRARIAAIVVALVAIIGAGVCLFSNLDAPSRTGRNATIRVRLYAWRYALELWREKPVTGVGEGGYTLLADALAADDVRDDPAALMDRISHAHNEWLEVGAELGVLGWVLLGGGLVLTLYGGGWALSRLGGTDRWILMGLLAGLLAAVVAESSGVALRVEGFSLVFYTVVGLVWALAGRQVTWVDGVSRRPALAGGVCALAVAAGVIFAEAGRRDFGAARAMADADAALGQDRPAEAVSLLEGAADQRLRPVRRLSALRQLAGAYLEAADQTQQRCFRRAAQAAQSGADQTLNKLADADRKQCLALVQAGEAVAGRLQRAAPDGFSTGWIVAGFKRVLAGFAQADGDMVAAGQHRVAAARALERQLARHPFQPAVAAMYVSTADGALSAADAIGVLAIPLRVNRVTGAYTTALAELAGNPQLRDVIQDIPVTGANCLVLEASDWPDRWIPEKLRVLAVGFRGAGTFDKAVEALQLADKLYARLDRPAPLAVVACKAELADAMFDANPLEADQAIAVARSAQTMVPDSQPGRTLSDDLGAAMVIYELAADREDKARELARSSGQVKSDELLDAFISDAYVSLAYRVFGFMAAHDRERLARWSRRALELDDTVVAGWFLAADVALVGGDEARAVQCIRAVIERQADSRNILDLLERARRTLPDSKTIQSIDASVRAQMGLTPDQAAAGEDKNAPPAVGQNGE